MRDKRTSSASDPGSGSGLSPAERTLRARLAAHTLHAKHDARETTAKARAAFLARFEAAKQARSAYFARLAFQRAKAARQAGGDSDVA